ncbi:pectate lyase [Dactylosporangium sp. AC04546]|uniref:pectate lyase n=1 Tax=Dactylosporangium sp. AC04546 TaxID=2862460 RepID=UPI001EDD84DA|nr:pectate lyase [Dactylosporangium sp. AC04546]WVK78371.1 pectate lyase [Dactylosporangium sp. AC04546]
MVRHHGAPPVRRTGRRRGALFGVLALVLAAAATTFVVRAADAATIVQGAWYNLVNVNSGKVMEVTGGSSADGATITQYSSNGCQCQQFRFESAGTGWWRIVARHSGKAVDLWEWNTGDGAEYRQWPITSGYNQQFSVQNIGDNIQLINRHSGKALEVWEWSTANGGRISQYTDLNGANQQWRLVQVGTTTPTTGGGGGGNPTTTWPTKTGDVSVSATVKVSGTLDGGMRRYCCIGDGGQSESQDPMFEVANGGTIKNVIIGAPAGDGIHCLGTCTIQNVWWEDVGEDAATFLGTGGGTSYVIGGGAKSASDKVFQHNGNGTVNISGFYVESAGKLYRACGNCTNSYQRHVVVDNIIARSTKVIAGININWGDTARFTRITVYGSATICDKYNGAPKGSEPEHVGSGADGKNCFYSSSDITYR